MRSRPKIANKKGHNTYKSYLIHTSAQIKTQTVNQQAMIEIGILGMQASYYTMP